MASSTLEQVLKADIAISGTISFAKFMERCLYEPGLGYYTKGKQVVGREGDFYTSVSTGSLFGQLLADGFYQLWQQLGQPESWQIVEQGANRADLAIDVLKQLEVIDEKAFLACSYIIVEPFPALQKLQRQNLESHNLGGKIRHVVSLGELPEKSIKGVYFSNELPDAFPVHCVKFFEGAWQELQVTWHADSNAFVWQAVSCSEKLLTLIKEQQVPAVEGYCAELSPYINTWVKEVAVCMAAGIFLTIDYGGTSEELYNEQRSTGTLRAYRQHQQSPNVLANPGEQDLTAHVNFSQIIQSGEKVGLKVLEYSDQHHYLVKFGKLRFFQEIEQAAAAGNSSAFAKKLRQYKTLMHPATMGSQFKVLEMTVG